MPNALGAADAGVETMTAWDVSSLNATQSTHADGVPYDPQPSPVHAGRWRTYPWDAASDTPAMSQEAIFEKVRSIVVEQLSVDAGEVKPESNFQNDLGADSLDTVGLVMALEEAFDIEIPDEAAEGIATVGDAVKYIQDKQA